MKKTGMKLVSALLAVIAMASGACAQEMREDGDNFFASTDENYRKVIDRVEKASHNNSYTGAVLIATEDGIILFGAPGVTTGEGKSADLHTTYNIGSCSKVFTAVAVFQLIEEGRISPDDPITRFFPEYGAGGEITVGHLMHMQSGIADYVNDPESFFVNVGAQDMEAFVMRSFRDEVTDGEFLSNLYAAPLAFAPGSEQSYCNTNYHLLALIIEQVSGMGYGDYVRENIFEKCGMEHTTAVIAGNETSVPRVFGDLLAAGIVDENGYTMAPRWERGAGGIHTCLADLWTFDRALLSGQLVGEASLEEMTRYDMGYGCGLYPYTKNAFGHSGRDGTYTTQNVVIDSEQYGKVYFIASTPTDAGIYGMDAVMQAAFFQLGAF